MQHFQSNFYGNCSSKASGDFSEDSSDSSGDFSSGSAGSSGGNFSSRIIKVDPRQPEASVIQRAAEVIINGGILIFPTDTVYGLGCSAFHEAGLERIFAMKERPTGKPLPALVSGPDQLPDLIGLNLICGQVSPLAQEIIREFWPGALTLIFPASDRIPNLITGGTKTIGVRMPKCQLLLDLIGLTKLPLVATSVNISGMPALQEMNHLTTEWAPKVDLILDGGISQGGIASTVLDLTTHPPKLLREGAISVQRLQRYLNPNPGPDQKTTE